MTRDISRRAVLRSLAAGAAGAGTTGGASAATADGRLSVVGTASAAATEAARAAATDRTRVLDFGDIGRTVVGRFDAAARRALRAREDVRYAEVSRRYRAITTSASNAQKLGWGVDRVDADVAHEAGITGDGVDVAILDTGIQADNPDLAPNLGAGKAFVECDERVRLRCRMNPDTGQVECNLRQETCQTPWDDDNDHGTHVAGIVAAVDDGEGVVGVAPTATLHAVKVLNAVGAGTDVDIARGVRYVADQGWDIANLSLGSNQPSSVLRDACRYAARRGVLLVAAAGNDGPCTDCVDYPAAFDTVFAVSATTQGDEFAEFSSAGPQVALAGPGDAVCSTVIEGESKLSGTSMAAPHVTGAAALVASTGRKPRAAGGRLRFTAEDVGHPPERTGSGLVDAAAALGLDSNENGTGNGTCGTESGGELPGAEDRGRARRG